MLVRRGEYTDLEARAKAEPADDVLTRDYYTLRPQIRLTGDPADRAIQPEAPTEVMLDGNDVARLVECAIRHPPRICATPCWRRFGTTPTRSGRFFSSV